LEHLALDDREGDLDSTRAATGRLEGRQPPDGADRAACAEGRPFKARREVAANAVFFTDTRLRAGTTCTYRIRACRELGCSPPSKEASATTFSR
jgi:hypothetical protein